MHSATFGSVEESSDQPVWTVLCNRPAVTESAVANKVTSWPRFKRPSVSSDANCSQGP